MSFRYQSILRCWFFTIVILTVGCDGNDQQARNLEDLHRAAALDPSHECAVCGMYVMNQAAPRAQILHRNGERVFFCSIGDMLVYNQTPSPLGKPEKIWVEAVGKDMQLEITGPEGDPWIDHEEAHYVTGIQREMVMGYPVIALQSKVDSEYLQKLNGGQLANWEQLLKQHSDSLESQVKHGMLAK